MSFEPKNLTPIQPQEEGAGFRPRLLTPVGVNKEISGRKIIPIEPTEKNTLQFFSELTDSIFGSGKIGEFLGVEAAKGTFGETVQRGLVGRNLSYEEESLVGGGPTGQEMLGSGIRSAALATPIGRIGSGAAAGLRTVGIGRGAGLGGAIVGGAAGGAALDVGSTIERGEPELTGTIVGAALPVGFAGGGQALKALGILGREIVGAGTGTGGQNIKRYFDAIKAGGPEARAAVDGLRGKVTPEVLVEDAKTALSEIKLNNSQQYRSALEAIAGETKTYNVAPIFSTLDEQLKKFGVVKTEDGGLDFSRSTIRFDKDSQGRVETIYNEMQSFGLMPGDRTAIGIDSLKKAFGDLYSDSSNVRAFVKAMESSARKILSEVKGYDELASKYEEGYSLIRDIERSLSIGDKASTETAFKKLVSSFRTNNELRASFLKELDKVSGNYLSARIAGQQLSEVLPRGLMRQVAVGGGIAAVPFGVGFLPLLSAAFITSPRIAGELLGALGIPAKFIDDVLVALQKAFNAGMVSPGDRLLGKTGEGVSDYVSGYIQKPRIGLQIEDVSKQGFQGFEDLSTKLLEKLKGRTTVSRQFIEDLSNSPDLKQAERDLIRRILGETGEDSNSVIAYRGGSKTSTDSLRGGRYYAPPNAPVWFSPRESIASNYGDNILKADLKNLKILDTGTKEGLAKERLIAQKAGFGNDYSIKNPAFTKQLISDGYDGIKMGNGDYAIFNPDSIKKLGLPDDKISVPDFTRRIEELIAELSKK